MKKIVLFALIINLLNCKNSPECFESSGKIIQKEISLDFFDSIEVGNKVSLILKQGNTQKVVIETGENILDAVTVEVIDNKLHMKEENSCNLTRDYALTKVYVTSPNIKEIRSNTARLIQSDGVLTFPELFLLSEDFLDSELLNIGDFNLNLDTDNLIIKANGISQFYIKGKTNGLRVEFHAGAPRFKGKDLIAKKVFILQKSTNNIITNPQISIKGNIFSIGDVICYHHPTIVNVEEHYSGKLIFR